MDKLERIYQLHRILAARRTPISRQDLEDRLGCSRATLTRLLAQCRNYLESPIEYDHERKGYYLDIRDGRAYELPGLWFSAEEIHALLTSHRLLCELKPGILEPHIAPLKRRLEDILRHKRIGNVAMLSRIRILPMAQRHSPLEDFQKTADALVNRRRLRIQYQGRTSDVMGERWVSPQRLVYYRDNWYLDAWCHTREALRTFSTDRMNVSEIGDHALNVPEDELNEHVTRTYGIFAGPVTGKAVIHFSAEAARWVADETWHPEQESRLIPGSGGKWELIVPYGNPAELLRDILKFGPDAEVMAPEPLRNLVADRLSAALRQYRRIKKV